MKKLAATSRFRGMVTKVSKVNRSYRSRCLFSGEARKICKVSPSSLTKLRMANQFHHGKYDC